MGVPSEQMGKIVARGELKQGVSGWMFNKRDMLFYIIAANVIALIAGVAGASLTVILFSSLLVPPLILLIIRIIR